RCLPVSFFPLHALEILSGIPVLCIRHSHQTNIHCRPLGLLHRSSSSCPRPCSSPRSDVCQPGCYRVLVWHAPEQWRLHPASPYLQRAQIHPPPRPRRSMGGADGCSSALPSPGCADCVGHLPPNSPSLSARL